MNPYFQYGCCYKEQKHPKAGQLNMDLSFWVRFVCRRGGGDVVGPGGGGAATTSRNTLRRDSSTWISLSG